MALYAKNNQEIGAWCLLSIFHTPPGFPSIVTTSNLWNFIPTPTTKGRTITRICPSKVTNSLLFQQLLNIQKLSPACRSTSRHFHLPPHYKDYVVTIQVSLNKANLNTINFSMPNLAFGNTLVATGLQFTCRN